jgi:hypothetical protein
MLSKVFNARRKELGTGINKRVSAAIETKDERALKAALVEMRALTAEEMSAVSEWVIACDNDESGGVAAACKHAQLVLDAVLSSKFMNRELTKAIREGDLEELLALLHVVDEVLRIEVCQYAFARIEILIFIVVKLGGARRSDGISTESGESA